MENEIETDNTTVASPKEENQVYTSEYLRKNTKLSGMQIFFLVVMGIGAVINLMDAFNTLEAYDSSGFHLPYRELWIIFYFVSFLASAYIIWCFIRREPNAVHLSMCYLAGSLISVIILMVLIYLNAEHTYRGSGAVALQNSGIQFSSFFFSMFWMIYLSTAEKTNETFPKPFRKANPIDYVVLALLIGIPVYYFSQCYIP